MNTEFDVNIVDGSPENKGSFKAEFRTGTDPKFYSNGLTFATREEAEAYGADLHDRWSLVVEHRAVESNEPVNYAFKHGALARVATVTPS